MTSRRFVTVDVFTDRPLAGNPVAVVLDAAGLSVDDMQRLAAWMNLSETTFLLPPTGGDANYRLRIFTPRGELSFAGHPTIGSAHAALETGMLQAEGGVLRQECAAGIVPLRIVGAGSTRRIFARVPEPTVTTMTQKASAGLCRVLGAPVVPVPRIVHVGPVWAVARVADAGVLACLTPDLADMVSLGGSLGLDGVTVFAETGGDPALVVRSFAPSAGIAEDPVCGSGNAAVAAYRLAAGEVRGGASWTAAQGRAVGRDGRVTVVVAPDDRGIEIGGAAVTVLSGTLAL